LKAALHHAAVALRRASSVVVCAHVRPDGDAVGSVLALTLALRSLGVPAIPTLADDREPSRTYQWMPGFGLYTPASDLEPPAVFVALDTPVPERLGAARTLAEQASTLVIIDHHPDAKTYGNVHVLDPTASATGQLIWQLLEALEVRPTPEIALCCYTALITDTGRFQYQNTTSAALRDAADMLDAGVDASEVARLVYQSRSAGSLALEALAMSRLTLANQGRVAYTWLADEDFESTGALPEEAEFLPDAVRVLDDIDVAMVLRERGDEVRVNLRAKTGFDVGALARGFGGGGHHAAAGLTWEQRGAGSFLAEVLPVLPGGEAQR
jgi:bifunctional oligoribonuclease and PAP phosphatase NrnA